MISFKTKEDVLPSSLILLSLVILTAALIYTLLIPDPTTAAVISSRHATIRTVTNDILYSQKRSDEASAAIEPRLWTGTPNHVSAAVLALVNESATGETLDMTAFRPQRSQDLDGVTELPFSVQLSGSFTGIRQVIRQIDGPKSKVVLRSVQVNASEEAQGTVTATLVISAYIQSPADTSTSTTETGGTGNGQA